MDILLGRGKGGGGNQCYDKTSLSWRSGAFISIIRSKRICKYVANWSTRLNSTVDFN